MDVVKGCQGAVQKDMYGLLRTQSGHFIDID